MTRAPVPCAATGGCRSKSAATAPSSAARTILSAATPAATRSSPRPMVRRREKTDRVLGADPATNEEVWVKDGRFGPLRPDRLRREPQAPVARPHDETRHGRPRRGAALLALPREIGTHPESGKPVTAGLNRRGGFVAHEDVYAQIPGDEDILSIGMNRALTLLAEGGKKARGPIGAQGTLKDLGPHPKDKKPVRVWPAASALRQVGQRQRQPAQRRRGRGFYLRHALKLIEAKSGKKSGPKRNGKAKPRPAMTVRPKPPPPRVGPSRRRSRRRRPSHRGKEGADQGQGGTPRGEGVRKWPSAEHGRVARRDRQTEGACPAVPSSWRWRRVRAGGSRPANSPATSASRGQRRRR